MLRSKGPLATVAFQLFVGVPFARSFSAAPIMKTVVVTGADGGIGSEFCRHYASSGAQVFACRYIHTNYVRGCSLDNVLLLHENIIAQHQRQHMPPLFTITRVRIFSPHKTATSRAQGRVLNGCGAVERRVGYFR